MVRQERRRSHSSSPKASARRAGAENAGVRSVGRRHRLRLGDHRTQLRRRARGGAAGEERVRAALRPLGHALPGALPGRIELAPRVWYNRASRALVLPVILALVMLLNTSSCPRWASCAKEIGTLEQLLVTPLRPWQLILGSSSPFGMIGLVAWAR